ncbi:polymorphic repeat outer membrane protein, putative, partial [Trichomonas vaginalis G3]
MLVLFLPPLICSHFSFPKRLEGVDKPIFQDDNNSSQSHIDIETRIDAGIELTSNNGTSSTLRINYEYYMCSVIIKEASFDNNYAFGAVTGGPCGGALYGYCSGMEIHNCKFSKNCAVDGGAISLTECTAFLESNITGSSNDSKTFDSNTAYCFGGAISFEGNINNSKTLQIFNYVFINNTAYEAGGAIQAIVNSD